MARVTEKSIALASLVILGCLHGSAQTVQGLPEIDTYVKLSSDLRVSFQVKETREGGDPTQAEIYPALTSTCRRWFGCKKPLSLISTTRSPGFWCFRSDIAICRRRTMRPR